MVKERRSRRSFPYHWLSLRVSLERSGCRSISRISGGDDADESGAGDGGDRKSYTADSSSSDRHSSGDGGARNATVKNGGDDGSAHRPCSIRRPALAQQDVLARACQKRPVRSYRRRQSRRQAISTWIFPLALFSARNERGPVREELRMGPEPIVRHAFMSGLTTRHI